MPEMPEKSPVGAGPFFPALTVGFSAVDAGNNLSLPLGKHSREITSVFAPRL